MDWWTYEFEIKMIDKSSLMDMQIHVVDDSHVDVMNMMNLLGWTYRKKYVYGENEKWW